MSDRHKTRNDRRARGLCIDCPNPPMDRVRKVGRPNERPDANLSKCLRCVDCAKKQAARTLGLYHKRRAAMPVKQHQAPAGCEYRLDPFTGEQDLWDEYDLAHEHKARCECGVQLPCLECVPKSAVDFVLQRRYDQECAVRFNDEGRTRSR